MNKKENDKWIATAFNAQVDKNKQTTLNNSSIPVTKSVKDILLQNQNYNNWKNEIELKLDEEKKKIEKLNKSLDIDEFKLLPYDKAKEVFSTIKYNLDFQNQRKQLEKIIQIKESEVK